MIHDQSEQFELRSIYVCLSLSVVCIINTVNMKRIIEHKDQQFGVTSEKNILFRYWK